MEEAEFLRIAKVLIKEQIEFRKDRLKKLVAESTEKIDGWRDVDINIFESDILGTNFYPDFIIFLLKKEKNTHGEK